MNEQYKLVEKQPGVFDVEELKNKVVFKSDGESHLIYQLIKHYEEHKYTPPNYDELDELVRPVMKWLAENCHPHTHIQVDSNSMQLFEGCHVLNTDEYLVD